LNLSVIVEMRRNFPGSLPELEILTALRTHKRLNVVFGGGGIRGIALIGFLRKAEELGIDFTGVGGVSTGALFGALYAAGYNSTELEKLALETDFSHFLDGKGRSLKLLDPSIWVSVYEHMGTNPGKSLETWLNSKLYAKNGYRLLKFKDVGKNLRILAADVTHREPVVFDKKLTPESTVASAARMSAGIPLIYYPYRREGEERLVDGGIVSNMPMWLFKQGPTIGVRLVSTATRPPQAPRNGIEFIGALVGTVIDSRATADSLSAGPGRIVEIDTGDIDPLDFGLNEARKKELIFAGYKHAEEFFGAYAKIR
jgi:NTE family protein